MRARDYLILTRLGLYRESGNFYANPTNNMFKLLRRGGIVPQDWGPRQNNRMPWELGVGFTDLGCEPGNDASRYKRVRATDLLWRKPGPSRRHISLVYLMKINVLAELCHAGCDERVA